MINAANIVKSFNGQTALQNVSLRAAKGEIIGLIGPDGAGKTTLLRLLTGAMTAFTGSIELFGTANIETIKQRMGYVPQRFSLYGDMTVIENIALIGALYGVNAAECAVRSRRILEFTGLWPFRDRFSAKLSGGMKQKLALAAGMIHQPELLLLDEPTTGVDPIARREFWQLLYELNLTGTTIIAATPYMDEAELCRRVVFLNDGRVAADGSIDELTASYPYTILELTCDRPAIRPLLDAAHNLAINAFGSRYHIVTNDSQRTVADIKNSFRSAGLPEDAAELAAIRPSLEDVFIYFTAKGCDKP